MQDLVDATDVNRKVALDTETIGLYGKIRLLQVYQQGWPEVLIVDSPNHLEVAAYVNRVDSVWHNAHYDLTTIAPRFCPKKFNDTFLLSRLAQPEHQEYSLDVVMQRVLGFDPYKKAGLNKTVLQKSDWTKSVLTQQQLEYAAIDVYYLFDVYSAVCHEEDSQSYRLDMSTLRSCLDFQVNGMPLDQDKLNAEYDNIIQQLKDIPWVTKGNGYTFVHGRHSIQMPFNPNSPLQVKQVLGLEGTSKQILAEQSVAHGNTEAANVSKARSLRKLLNFVDKYIDSTRLEGKFKPSARSGRLTSDDENLQQIPRALKKVFGTKEDRVIIFSDYAQLELRTICAILGVTVMEKLFRAGEDLHGYVASILFGEDWTKADRQVTKTYNFNLLYGGSVNMVLSILMTYGMYIEHRLATRHKTKWLNLFGEINKWQQECIAKWKKGRLYSTPFGRQYKAKLMTDFMNIMNQGAGAEVAKLALHYFKPWLDEHHPDVKICNFIHDSFILDAPNDPAVYEPVAIKLAECMQEAWFQMSKLYKIKDLPMPVDVKVGHNWGDIEDGKNIDWEFTLDPYKMYKEAA